MLISALLLGFAGLAASSTCPKYTPYSEKQHPPLSSGKYHLSYMRPDPSCRSFVSQEVDATIQHMKTVIKDPDLYRLFENSWPNTLDTTIKWRGHKAGTDEELCFLITGDM